MLSGLKIDQAHQQIWLTKHINSQKLLSLLRNSEISSTRVDIQHVQLVVEFPPVCNFAFMNLSENLIVNICDALCHDYERSFLTFLLAKNFFHHKVPLVIEFDCFFLLNRLHCFIDPVFIASTANRIKQPSDRRAEQLYQLWHTWRCLVKEANLIKRDAPLFGWWVAGAFIIPVGQNSLATCVLEINHLTLRRALKHRMAL